MNPEGEIPKAFQQAFELPGDPTFSPDFPAPDITMTLPTWQERAEKGELGRAAYVDLKKRGFLHEFDGATWDVKAMTPSPRITDPVSYDGLLVKSGMFREARTDIFSELDRMAPHMRDGTPLVLFEATSDQEDHSTAPRDYTLREHGFEMVDLHIGDGFLVWEGRRINDRAELELAIETSPMIPRALIESPLARQLPAGKVLYVDSKHPKEAHSVDRNSDWRVSENKEDVYARKRGSHKLSAVVIGIQEALSQGSLPKDLIAKAGSLIRQSEDPKNAHLGGVFVVWPEGGYNPTKTELIKLFKNAGLKVDEEQPHTFEGVLDDGRKVIVAQARTWKYTKPPEEVREGYTRGKGKFEMPELNKLIHVEGQTCGDCGVGQIYEKYEVKHWVNPDRNADHDLLKKITICNSGRHEGGRPVVISDLLVKNLGPHKYSAPNRNSTPRPQSSRGHRVV